MERASVADDAAFESYLMAVPPRPEALRWREGSFPRTSLGYRLSVRGEDKGWYGEKAIGWLQDRPAATWFPTLVPPLGGECEARRVEILEAWDGYIDDRRSIAVATGYAATCEASDAAADLVVTLAAEIAASRPRTLSGLLALGAWFARRVAADDLHDDFLEQLAEAVASFGEVAS